MSSTLRATTSHPRSLLSIARLNIARSRLRFATWSLVRIDQTCFGRSGGLAPISLPLFQPPRLGAVATGASLSCMVILLVFENDQHGLNAIVSGRQSASGYLGATVAAELRVRRQILTQSGPSRLRACINYTRGHRKIVSLDWSALVGHRRRQISNALLIAIGSHFDLLA